MPQMGNDKHICGDCGSIWLRPNINQGAYGEFVYHSKNQQYVYAEIFNDSAVEFMKILKKIGGDGSEQINGLTKLSYALPRILIDPDQFGDSFKLVPFNCYTCGSQKNWSSIIDSRDLPEEERTSWVPDATYNRWDVLTTKQKYAAMEQCLREGGYI